MKKRLMIIATLVLAMCYIAKAENKVTISDFEISAGETKEVSISLDNDEAYVAFQFDLYLPEGITIESQSADRSRVPEQTTVDMARLSNGSYRFISTAISGESLTGNSGGIVKLTVKASKNLEIGEKTGYFRKVKLSKADATGPTYEEMSFTVNVVEPSVVTAKSYSRVYGDANPTFEYTVEGATLNGTPSITCEATATSPVGTYPITIAKGDVTNENVTLVNGTLTITKAPLTIMAGEYTKTQGEENPEFTLTYEGFKNNETSEVLTTKPTVSCEATKESVVGEYTVTVSGAVATNYEISYTNGKLTISEAPVTITATSYSRAYGEANPTFEYTSTGATLNGTPTITCEATATSPVGTYPITIAKGDVTNGNVTLVNGTLTITKAPLSIKAGEYTKTQGEDNPDFTLTYEGFKNNETSEVLTTKPTVSCDATKESAVGEYTVTVSGAEATNYEISYTNGKLTIKPVEFVVDTGSEGEGSGETQVTYAVTNNGNSEESETPTVAVSDGGDAKGDYEIPETVEYNGVVYTVTEIADNAFQNNTALTEITIPSTIESIGDNAFAGCSNLESITVNIETPIDLSSTAAARGVGTRGNGSAVFEGVNKETCKLYVLEGSVEKYKAADVWKEFVNILPIASSGIRTILNTDGRAFDVFDLNGRKVKAKTISTEGLPKGVYIINNKKVVIR